LDWRRPKLTGRQSASAFQKRHHINAARLKHCASRQIDFVKFQPLELVFDAARRAWQKAGAHTIGFLAQTQIKTGRLELVCIKRTTAFQRAAVKQGCNLVVWKDAELTQKLVSIGKTGPRRLVASPIDASKVRR
jgi:hypothetical protein